MLTNRLNIGFIIDENPIPYWKYDIIDKISQSDFCKLCQINLVDHITKEKNTKKSFFESLLFYMFNINLCVFFTIFSNTFIDNRRIFAR